MEMLVKTRSANFQSIHQRYEDTALVLFKQYQKKSKAAFHVNANGPDIDLNQKYNDQTQVSSGPHQKLRHNSIKDFDTRATCTKTEEDQPLVVSAYCIIM